jgi:hypothetical protein
MSTLKSDAVTAITPNTDLSLSGSGTGGVKVTDYFVQTKGSDIASATALALGKDGNAFDVTGTTTITSIGTQGIGSHITLQFDGVLTFTHHSTDLILPGSANITTAAGDIAVMYEYASGDWRCVSYTKASGAGVVASDSSFGLNFIGGLTLSNDSGDTSHDINITVGAARDTTDASNMVLASEITKRIDASWAVGNDNGGLDGTESSAGTADASTVYYVWLIMRTDTSVVDVLFSESATSPTMPTNYDRKRLIGFVATNASSGLRQFVQRGNYFRWTSALVTELNDTSLSTTFELATFKLPAHCIAKFHVHIANAHLTTGTQLEWRLFIRPVAGTAEVSSEILDASAGVKNTVDGDDTSATEKWSTDLEILLDSSSQFEYATSSTAAAPNPVQCRPYACEMLTRTDP